MAGMAEAGCEAGLAHSEEAVSVEARGGTDFLLIGEKAGMGILNRSGRHSLDEEQAGAEAQSRTRE